MSLVHSRDLEGILRGAGYRNLLTDLLDGYTPPPSRKISLGSFELGGMTVAGFVVVPDEDVHPNTVRIETPDGLAYEMSVRFEPTSEDEVDAAMADVANAFLRTVMRAP